ncbi:NDP-sugar epimerase, includes UDP-GlcNAc-inverting 4,6-dehydratase FlaA1 and capsular polysaccharide biosynthesis protein EpsC [Chromohalobacter canadensis]|uniref:NDP-sugar epimerase, includes UDP-GlcNAc-inverting 4,6-dehydratase FlaA1 and capsular polysaccharide biosynthesis protein EpsC n=1 Tax=Chromohalobacter canadensis TaxID=141389 RepID=A0A285VTU4_9GAMM|nr:nucleoside-diphosphate sugar epimerase/dehydratase [Chromohalobacter canadensis]SOC57479.1 NDP-sugar epimerase, includes UDP-GlcNAc-inverting 4,6-dehydratase FlaA1 and capsular polysaccharide biosynthesis protein EpsC [Chromohalobacter canadensis]
MAQSRIHQSIAELGRAKKRLIMVAADLVALPLALWTAYALRFAEWWPASFVEPFWWLFLVVPPVGVFVFARLGLYRAVVRFMGPQALSAVIKGALLLALLMWASAYLYEWQMFPRSVPVSFALVTLVYVGGTRLLVRAYYQWLIKHYTEKEPVAIYGSGDSGVQLALALSNGREFDTVAFLDDDSGLWNCTIKGVKVHDPSRFKAVAQELGIKRVLLAMPSATKAQRKQALDKLEDVPVRVQTVPSMPEIVSGIASVDQLREVELEDLLGRDPVLPQHDLVDASIRNKVVMVTGAGGSIGSEMCRQVIRGKPKTLVLFEVSEFGLYAINQELEAVRTEMGERFSIVPLLGNVCDRNRVEAAIHHYGVQTLYHAAAYKHVPIVENNVLEGLRNNVHGTRVVAESCANLGVERCVLISTDKAVRPTNVMGATKRMAELVLQDLATHDALKDGHRTIFSMVRFGNVLGSSGSVVPLFRRQIEKGGPITVTHPDITRFFMTIPEAALLVIQAGSMAEGGDVFVLDMGESVKIVDLARRMIQLTGLEIKDEEHVDGDIEVVYSGLRAGEKLYEELLIGDNVVKTGHSKIMRAQEETLPHQELIALLGELQEAEQTLDCQRACELLKRGVNGFSHNGNIVDLLPKRPAVPNKLAVG